MAKYTFNYKDRPASKVRKPFGNYASKSLNFRLNLSDINRSYSQSVPNNSYSLQENMDAQFQSAFHTKFEKLKLRVIHEIGRLGSRIDECERKLTHVSALIDHQALQHNVAPVIVYKDPSVNANDLFCCQTPDLTLLHTAYPRLNFYENPFSILGHLIKQCELYSTHQYGCYMVQILKNETPQFCTHLVVQTPNGTVSFKSPINLGNITTPLHQWLTISNADVSIYEPELRDKPFLASIKNYLDYNNRNDEEKQQIFRYLTQCLATNTVLKINFDVKSGTLESYCPGV